MIQAMIECDERCRWRQRAMSNNLDQGSDRQYESDQQTRPIRSMMSKAMRFLVSWDKSGSALWDL